MYWQAPTGQIILNKVNPMGYIALAEDELTYNYYAKDYLGNIRETYQVTQTSGPHPYQVQTKQQVQYYPSGLPWAATFFSGANLQPYKYGGKEFIEFPHNLPLGEV